jgi:hypothetical protein
MSNRRFLEIYSANRNREQFPNMAKFDILFGAPRNVDDPIKSYDPILNGSIYYTWQGGQGIDGTTGVSEGVLKTGTTDAIPLLLQTNGNPIQGLPLGPTGPSILSSVPNYYQGYGFTDMTGTNNSNRLIIGYNPSSASIILNNALNDSHASDNYIIYDPSTSDTIHIPSVDGLGNPILTYSEAYTNYYVVDETLSNSTNIVSRKIVSYDFITQLAKLESPFPSGWSPSDFFTLRKTLPSEKITILGITGGNQLIFPSSIASPVQNFYAKSYVYNTTLGAVDGPSGTYINSFSPNGNNQAFYIKYYGGSSGFTADTNQFIYPYCASVIPSASASIIPGTYKGVTGNNIINIVKFKSDNNVPLIYNGSLVSQNESVCYEIALINLSLPNVVLTTGSRIAFYPYVYVQLTNISASTSASNYQFYTNNPDAYTAMFQAPVTDISNPVNSSFLKIDSGSMMQTIKFKPNDCLRFSVFLPDGTLFQPVQPDTLSPYPPNYLLQIDAMFSINRLP